MNAVAAVSPSPRKVWNEPLLLQVRHLTRYLYNGAVWDSYNEARLCPRSDPSQEVNAFHLNITPVPVIRSYPDFYGNCVHYFDVVARHDQLDVEALSEIRTHPDHRGPPPEGLSIDQLKATNIEENFHDFLHDSHFVSLEAEVWRSAVDALPNGVTDLWQDALRIGRHIHSTFTYTPYATTVNTRPVEVVRTHKGVCQDFAHVMLAMCRIHGIPARYVSGYFYNPNRSNGDIEASHAWVEIFLPGYGWKGFDPTHDHVPDTRYVKLAVGRDYGDIMPVGGAFRGKGTRSMIVEVQVSRMIDG